MSPLALKAILMLFILLNVLWVIWGIETEWHWWFYGNLFAALYPAFVLGHYWDIK